MREREACTICKREIMYESPDNFDPVCMNEYGDVHCEECCTCGEDLVQYLTRTLGRMLGGE
jgi:hypothetical protein